jgi:hypothetical protein
MISVVSWSGLLVLGLVVSLHVVSAILDKLGKPNPVRDPLAQVRLLGSGSGAFHDPWIRTRPPGNVFSGSQILDPDP